MGGSIVLPFALVAGSLVRSGPSEWAGARATGSCLGSRSCGL